MAKTSFHKHPYFILLLIFVISRVCVINFFNLKFEYDWVFQMWHFIDIKLLKTNLLESVLYFHYQPPLYNLFLGFIHQQSMLSPILLLRIIFYAISFLMGLIIFKTSLKINHSTPQSIILASLFYLFPETILYENWPIYTWTSSFLLLASFYLLNLYRGSRKAKYLSLFFWAQLILILTRSAFHPVFYFGWFILFFFGLKKERLKVIKAFVPPTIILLLIFFKNLYIFDFFSLGSGLGFSLYKITPKYIDQKHVTDIIKLDPVYKIGPVKSISSYGFNSKPVPEKFKNIEVLNTEYKTTLGRFTEEFSVNLGHYHYLEIAKRYQQSAIEIIKKFPKDYAQRVIRAVIMFFKPTWDHGFGLENNSIALFPYINLVTLNNLRLDLENSIKKIRKPWPLKNEIPLSSYLIIPFAYFVILLFMFRFKWLRFEKIEYMFILYCVIYIFSVSNLIELAENDRYRVMIDPLVYLGLCHILSNVRSRNNSKFSQ